MQNLYWFITISKRSDAEAVIELYQELEVPRVYSCLANGTAKSQILDLLGLELCEKAVHQTVITHNKLHELQKRSVIEWQQIPTPSLTFLLVTPICESWRQTSMCSFVCSVRNTIVTNKAIWN